MTDQQQQQQFVKIPLQQWIQNEADRVGGRVGEATVTAIGGIDDQQQQNNNNNTLWREEDIIANGTFECASKLQSKGPFFVVTDNMNLTVAIQKIFYGGL